MNGRRLAGLSGCCCVIGTAAGFAAALFLWSLDHVTQLHWQHPWLLFLLPLAGLLSGILYATAGGRAEGGTELILQELRAPAEGVPGRMAPLVLCGTLITHLCGGSAGREGTAVQMGGSLAAVLARYLRMPAADLPLLLACGMAGGFGAVFGTPLAGAVFAVEVCGPRQSTGQAATTSGKLRRLLLTLLLSLLAALVADGTVELLGVAHTEYHVAGVGEGTGVCAFPPVTPAAQLLLAARVAVAGAAFGLAGGLFTRLRNAVRTFFRRHIARAWLRPAIGGALVMLAALLTGGTSYLGLGVEASPQHPHDVCIRSCLAAGAVGGLSWFWKLLFTAVTVGSGFKGGEVTPLFFVGAALGNVLAHLLAMPAGPLAAMGFAAVFAGAARTPIACTLMALEVFGPGNPGLLSASSICATALCCFVAAKCSGKAGLYDSLPEKSAAAQ